MMGLKQKRLSLCLDALGTDGFELDTHGQMRTIAELLESFDPEVLWVVIVALTARMPTLREMDSYSAQLRGIGSLNFVKRLLRFGLLKSQASIKIIRDQVLVDIRHTSETELATGIQRVARNVARCWEETRQPVFLSWTDRGDALRELTEVEKQTGLFGKPVQRKLSSGRRKADVLLPINCLYILPELAAESWRTKRLAAMAKFSPNRTGVIGFDCVPIFSSETVGIGMGRAFALNLRAVSFFDSVAAISQAAAAEYRAWREMLDANVAHIPKISAIQLASQMDTEPLPLVNHLESNRRIPDFLIVGSHEPRKNHLAVLRCAESLWAEGLEFTLTFLGGNSWNSFAFEKYVDGLRDNGAIINLEAAVSDRRLLEAYRQATALIFPSLNEGFGLPVAEALELGVPVITSNFGSTKEIAISGGVIMVNPRSDDEICGAMRNLIENPDLVSQLRRETRNFEAKTWSIYADELWNFFNSPD